MKIFNLMKRDKCAIYQNANNSFDFDYSVQTGSNEKDSTLFKDANKNIDIGITYEMKEVDYYA